MRKLFNPLIIILTICFSSQANAAIHNIHIDNIGKKQLCAYIYDENDNKSVSNKCLNSNENTTLKLLTKDNINSKNQYIVFKAAGKKIAKFTNDPNYFGGKFGLISELHNADLSQNLSSTPLDEYIVYKG